ncbi:sulfite exporter TauE/SafE family protein [Methylobacterium organophilum]|nr:sulfite exporter TauE/SafE family protein [Methylobacterium organophilum]
MLGTVGFAFLAGLLSVLSPCVLPLIPIVLGTAAAEHRLGPVALAAGLAVAFTAIGLFVATIGFTVGLDGDVFRRAGAVLLVLLGAVLMLPRLQARVATAAGPIGAWAEDRFGGAGSGGVSGQFAVGLLLGAAWSPCVGPTLGAASLMAARGEPVGSEQVQGDPLDPRHVVAQMGLIEVDPPPPRRRPRAARICATRRHGVLRRSAPAR